MTAPDDPVQTEFSTPPAPVTMGDTSLEPLAAFTLTARVLSRANYRFDAGPVISPMDLAVGWGRMSDSTVLRDIDLEQQDRYYFWHASTPPIPQREIETHSANLHRVPADPAITRRLESIRAGAASCELLYVRELSIGPRRALVACRRALPRQLGQCIQDRAHRG